MNSNFCPTADCSQKHTLLVIFMRTHKIVEEDSGYGLETKNILYREMKIPVTKTHTHTS